MKRYSDMNFLLCADGFQIFNKNLVSSPGDFAVFFVSNGNRQKNSIGIDFYGLENTALEGQAVGYRAGRSLREDGDDPSVDLPGDGFNDPVPVKSRFAFQEDDADECGHQTDERVVSDFLFA